MKYIYKVILSDRVKRAGANGTRGYAPKQYFTNLGCSCVGVNLLQVFQRN